MALTESANQHKLCEYSLWTWALEPALYSIGLKMLGRQTSSIFDLLRIPF